MHAERAIRLPKAGHPIKFNRMSDDPCKTELASWLELVGIERDKSAFTDLFRYFAPRIYHISLSKFGSETLANDVVQETMTNIWRKAHLFDSAKGQATTWVYTIMRNVSFDMLRRISANKEDNLSGDLWGHIDNAEEDSSLEPFRDHLADRELQNGIDNLPDDQKQVVESMFYQDLSQSQIAEKLGIPLGTVKSRLRLAMTKLKHHIGEKHD